MDHELAVPSVALVLSGGASLGAIQVGMLRLHEREIKPDLIVATSVETITGALIATRPQTVEMADEPATIWHGYGAQRSFPSTPERPARLPRDARLPRPGFGLRQLVAKHLEGGRLEELPTLL